MKRTMADMNINFSTYSEAARAYDILKTQNINARIVRTPASLKRSCGYSLKISEADYSAAGRIISGGSQNHARANRFAYPPNNINY